MESRSIYSQAGAQKIKLGFNWELTVWVQVCYVHKPHILVVFHRNIFTVEISLAVEEKGFKCNLYQLAKLLCFEQDDSQVIEHVS